MGGKVWSSKLSARACCNGGVVALAWPWDILNCAYHTRCFMRGRLELVTCTKAVNVDAGGADLSLCGDGSRLRVAGVVHACKRLLTK